jgi:hypothetical protein
MLESTPLENLPPTSPSHDWLPTGITALNTFLKSNPNAEQRIREIIDKRLGNIDASSWPAVFVSLENYLGKEATDVLDYVLQTQVGQSEVLKEISKSGSSQTMSFLRTLTSLYGPELEKAFFAIKQLPDNWKMFYRDVYYDFVNKRYQIRIRLEKYNGETPIIEGDADSMLELTHFMIQTLLFINSRDAFKESLINQFIELANQFTLFLRPPASETENTQPESKITK